jgi:hypothetical protein
MGGHPLLLRIMIGSLRSLDRSSYAEAHGTHFCGETGNNAQFIYLPSRYLRVFPHSFICAVSNLQPVDLPLRSPLFASNPTPIRYKNAYSPPCIVSPPLSTPSSVQSSPSRQTLSPPHRCRQADFQDILMFDPAGGSLSLQNNIISHLPVEQTLSVPSFVPGIGGTSISLPSRLPLGHVSAPFPAPAIALHTRSSGTVPGVDKFMVIVGHESEVMTWNLRRGQGWPGPQGARVARPLPLPNPPMLPPHVPHSVPMTHGQLHMSMPWMYHGAPTYMPHPFQPPQHPPLPWG